MIVKERKPITFYNNCSCLVNETDLEKAINWYSDKPVTRSKKIFLHGNYPAVAIYKEKIHVHRLLMMYWLDRKLKTEEYVHHKDHNKLKATKDNLEIMEQSKHQSLHTKGRKFTKEHRQKISEANRKRKGIKYIKKAE